MKLTIDWLKDHISTNKIEAQIVEKLNNIGLEVESVKPRNYSQQIMPNLKFR